GLPPTVEDPAALERAAAALRLATPSEPVVSSPRKRRRETAEVTVVVT
ncbi:MAG: hypothetical protein JO364_09595, partial [Pseudonocardiales bacterium]|nr:hypothetical protein [Pseudonocardiales bacterium]MBV9030546.1 hypothetical protein [Pseudonocardiales bacterium]